MTSHWTKSFLQRAINLSSFDREFSISFESALDAHCFLAAGELYRHHDLCRISWVELLKEKDGNFIFAEPHIAFWNILCKAEWEIKHIILPPLPGYRKSYNVPRVTFIATFQDEDRSGASDAYKFCRRILRL